MKLRNPSIVKELRKFYRNGWCHEEVRCYLTDHYGLVVSKRPAEIYFSFEQRMTSSPP